MAESREVRALRAYIISRSVPHRVASTCRAGAVTAAGYPSRHGATGTDGCGLAVDFAGPTPGRDTADLGRLFWAFEPVFAHLHELIYAGPQTSFNIKNGRRVAKYATATHHDHVHSSVDLGVFLAAMPVEDDMTPEQARLLAQVAADVAAIKSELFTGDAPPVGAMVAETNERTKRFGVDFGKIKQHLGLS